MICANCGRENSPGLRFCLECGTRLHETCPNCAAPHGEGITFWALGGMVRSRANLVEGDDEATSRRKLTAAVGECVPDESERDWVLDGLLGLLGIESPRGSREQLFAAWRTFFERIAQRGPVMLV